MEAPVCNLTDKKCKPCEGGVAPLAQAEVADLLKQLDGWQVAEGISESTTSQA